MILLYFAVDDQTGGAIPAAVGWIARALVGPAATGIAILAVAILGFGMLWGRLDVRTVGRVALGAFILFGAPTIAFHMSAGPGGGGLAAPSPVGKMPPLSAALHMPKKAPVQDPYAGAAVPQLQQ